MQGNYNVETENGELVNTLSKTLGEPVEQDKDGMKYYYWSTDKSIVKALYDYEPVNRWHDNWDAITPIFKFSPDVRKVIYTTNAIESLNSTYRKLNRQRSVFPGDTALLKALYLATFEATKKWTMSIRNWGQVYGELSIMYEGRLPE